MQTAIENKKRVSGRSGSICTGGEKAMFALMPGCLIFAGLFIYLQRKNYGVPALLLKGLASLCFAALGILCNAGAESGKPIVLGLILGCVADVLLGLRSVFVGQKKVFFLVGGLVFLCGHFAYLASAWPRVENKVLCGLASVLLAALLLVWLYGKITADRGLRAFGVVYFGVFTLLCCVAVSNDLTAHSAFTRLFASGILLFLCSDLILNLHSFGPLKDFRFRVLYSGLYYIGQLTIAVSLLFL